VIDFDGVAAQCAPHVAVATLRAIAEVESGFNPYAIGVVGGALTRQPRNLLEAISTVRQLQVLNIRFSAGITQIYVENWPAYRLDAETVFDPCANLRAAQGILSSCYQRAVLHASPDQVALRHAISCYYSDNFVTGFRDGYVRKVVFAATRLRASAQKVPAPSGS
jgi:type IV secretion system protein VirB1